MIFTPNQLKQTKEANFTRMVQKQQHLASQFSQNLVTQTNSERLFWIIIDTQLNLREYLKNTVTKIKKQSDLKKFFQKSINPRTSCTQKDKRRFTSLSVNKCLPLWILFCFFFFFFFFSYYYYLFYLYTSYFVYLIFFYFLYVTHFIRKN